MDDLRIRLRLDGTGIRDGAAAAASSSSVEEEEEIAADIRDSLRLGFIQRGKTAAAYKTYHEHTYSQMLEGIHTSFKREKPDEGEYYLLECLLFIELGDKESQNIITNLLTTLRVHLVAESLCFARIKSCMLALNDLERFELRGRTMAAATLVRRAFSFLTAGLDKSTVASDIKAFYFDQPFLASRVAPETSGLAQMRVQYRKKLGFADFNRLLFKEQQPGDDHNALVDAALFSMLLEKRDPGCFFFAFHLLVRPEQYKSCGFHRFVKANELDTRSIQRKTPDFLLWKVLEAFIRHHTTINNTSKNKITSDHLQFVRYMRQLYITIRHHKQASLAFVQAALVFFHSDSVNLTYDKEVYDELADKDLFAMDIDNHRHTKKLDLDNLELPDVLDPFAPFLDYSRPEWRQARLDWKPTRKRKIVEEETQQQPKKRHKKPAKEPRWLGEELEGEEELVAECARKKKQAAEAAAAAAAAKPSKANKLRREASKYRAFRDQQLKQAGQTSPTQQQKQQSSIKKKPSPREMAAAASAAPSSPNPVYHVKRPPFESKYRPRVVFDRRVHNLQLAEYPVHDQPPRWYCSVRHRLDPARKVRFVVQASSVSDFTLPPFSLINTIKKKLGLVHDGAVAWVDHKKPDVKWIIRWDRSAHMLPEGGKYPTERVDGLKVAKNNWMLPLSSFNMPTHRRIWSLVWQELMWRFVVALKGTSLDSLVLVKLRKLSDPVIYSWEAELANPDADLQFKRKGIRQLFDTLPPDSFLVQLNKTRDERSLKLMLHEWKNILDQMPSSAFTKRLSQRVHLARKLLKRGDFGLD
jgi:hypothetical protein